MFLIFDTETTSLPNDKLPANHPEQARIIQLAWILLDEQFQERASFCSLIRLPESVLIHPGAQAAHGISWKECWDYGQQLVNVMDVFDDVYNMAKLRIAHNEEFDTKLLDIEDSIELGKESTRFRLDPNKFCTMKVMTDLCKLPFPNGRSRFGQKYKWPKLEEACRFAGISFNEEEAHSAIYDVRKTGELFKWLFLNGHVLHDPNLKIQHEVIPT